MSVEDQEHFVLWIVNKLVKISQKNKRVIIGKNMAINHQGRLLVQEKNKTELTEVYSGSIECV